MLPSLMIVAAIAALVASIPLYRFAMHSRGSRRDGELAPSATDTTDIRPHFPDSGILVSDDVLRAAGSSATAVWHALESAAVPLAVEYFPVSDAEVAKYRTIPINAAAQQSIVEIVKALNPKSPTLYRVVLPQGAELVKAVGAAGFRGFARDGSRITAQAVLKPVAAGGAIAAGWPAFAVAGTVMVVDMAAQRELRAHQRRVEKILGRHEERHYIERIKDQRSADAQLTRAVSMILDGRNPNLELALKSADDEFHRSLQFLEKHRGVIEQLVDVDGKVDHRRLEEVLGGKGEDLDHFLRELHMARGAIAIKKKALLIDAASVALADPNNSYAALHKFLGAQAHQLEDADSASVAITKQLSEIQLKGGWRNSKAARKEQHIRALAATPALDGDLELRFLRTASGDIVQVVAVEEDGIHDDLPVITADEGLPTSEAAPTSPTP